MSQIATSIGEPLEPALLANYFSCLINRLFKILPIRESGEASLPVYIDSLQIELCGCVNLIPVLHTNAMYLALLAVLQYLKDNPDYPVRDVRRQVFRAIGMCNKLRDNYTEQKDCGVIK